MNDGVLIKRVGIVLLIVSIFLLISAICGAIFSAFMWFTLGDGEQSLGTAIGTIFLAIIAIVIGFISAIVFIIGIINLFTSIALLKSGTDLNIIKRKRGRIAFCNIILYLTAIAAVIGGFYALFGGAIPIAVIAFALAIIVFALGITLSKTLKTINKMRKEEAN